MNIILAFCYNGLRQRQTGGLSQARLQQYTNTPLSFRQQLEASSKPCRSRCISLTTKKTHTCYIIFLFYVFLQNSLTLSWALPVLRRILFEHFPSPFPDIRKRPEPSLRRPFIHAFTSLIKQINMNN